MSPGNRPSPNLATRGQRSPTATSTKPKMMSSREIDIAGPVGRLGIWQPADHQTRVRIEPTSELLVRLNEPCSLERDRLSGIYEEARCYPPSISLLARKFSLLWALGNSVGKRLSLLPKAEARWPISSPSLTNFAVFSRETGKQTWQRRVRS